MGVDNSGAGFLAVRGEGGKYIAVIGDKGLQIMNADGMTAVAQLGPDNARKPVLRLADDKAGGIELGTATSGTGYLVVRATNGQPALALGTDGSGQGRLTVRGENRAVATLGASQQGQVGLTMGVENQVPGATFENVNLPSAPVSTVTSTFLPRPFVPDRVIFTFSSGRSIPAVNLASLFTSSYLKPVTLPTWKLPNHRSALARAGAGSVAGVASTSFFSAPL